MDEETSEAVEQEHEMDANPDVGTVEEAEDEEGEEELEEESEDDESEKIEDGKIPSKTRRNEARTSTRKQRGARREHCRTGPIFRQSFVILNAYL